MLEILNVHPTFPRAYLHERKVLVVDYVPEVSELKLRDAFDIFDC